MLRVSRCMERLISLFFLFFVRRCYESAQCTYKKIIDVSGVRQKKIGAMLNNRQGSNVCRGFWIQNFHTLKDPTPQK